MHPVKKSLLIASVLLLFVAYVYAVLYNFNSHPVKYEINEQHAYFYLGKKTKRQDLEHLQLVFKIQKDIDINYAGTTFGLNGRVLKLELLVDDHQGSRTRISDSSFQPTLFEKDFNTGQTILKNVKESWVKSNYTSLISGSSTSSSSSTGRTSSSSSANGGSSSASH